MSSSEFVVFYAWQSDSPPETNLRAIREGLRDASSRLEEQYAGDGLRIVVDEATRGVPGSPNIPQTILAKIRSADVFVGDVTTVNPGPPACPNANVMVELGYAVAQLGWGRIVLAFNRAQGSFPNDLPFDIDRQRVASYNLSISSRTEAGKTKKAAASIPAGLKRPLFDVLYEALGAVLSTRPAKPGDADEIAPEVRKRRRDTEALRSLLATIHVPTMDKFLRNIPGRIPEEIFHFWEHFDAAMSSNLFHIYDRHLSTLVVDLHESWGQCFTFYPHFMPSRGGRYFVFQIPGDIFTPKQKRAWARMQKVGRKTGNAFGALLKHVRKKYPELDLAEASKGAWREFAEFRKEVAR